MNQAEPRAGVMQEREIFTREFDDPDAYTVANGLFSARVPGALPSFRARVTRADLGRVKVRIGEASSAVTMIGGIPNLHAFSFSIRDSAPRMLSGHEVSHGKIFHHRPNDIMFGHSPSGRPWPFATIALHFPTLAEAGASFGGRSLSPPRDDARLFDASAPAFQRLLTLLKDAQRVTMANPMIGMADASSRALSGVLLDGLLDCMERGEARHDRAAQRRHRRVVTRLDQVLMERPEQTMCLADMCSEIGVSHRTLHMACQEFLGMSAMRYARMRRLDTVREALKQSDPRRASVTDIAMRFGFWELDRFAAAYRQRFGEPPSSTLRRDFDWRGSGSSHVRETM